MLVSHFIAEPPEPLTERLRARFGRRAAGLLLTILLEAILALLVLAIGQPIFQREKEEVTIATFDTREVPEPPEQAKAVDRQKADVKPALARKTRADARNRRPAFAPAAASLDTPAASAADPHAANPDRAEPDARHGYRQPAEPIRRASFVPIAA